MLHGKSFEKLHEFIPPEILPQCAGGLLSNNDAEDKEFMANLMIKDQYYRGKKMQMTAWTW